MRISGTAPLAVGVSFLVLAVAGCTDGKDGSSGLPSHTTQAEQSPTPSTPETAAPWPAPRDPLKRIVAAGLKPEVQEHLTYHVHAHLDAFVDGKSIMVPAGLGINIGDADVHRFTDPDGSVAYGGIERCGKACISPLHTHDATGILHTESATSGPNTLGQLFTEWGVRLSGSCVEDYCSPTPIAFYVNGTLFTQDPGAIQLTDHKEIAVVIGTPPSQIPKTADFSKA